MNRNIKTKFLDFWAYWILFALTIVIQAFVDDASARDFKLITTMAISVLILPFVKKRIDRQDFYLFLVLITLFFSSITIFYEQIKISSLFLTAMFFFTFILYKNLCKQGCVKLDSFLLFVRWTIIAFCIVLVIQQLQWLIGIHPINERYWEGIKRSSLAMEPSNTTIVIPVLLYVYMKLQEIIRNEKKYRLNHMWQEDKIVWLAGLYVCLTCGSMTMVFTIPFLFSYFINKRIVKYLPIITLLSIASIWFINRTQKDLYHRFTYLIENLDKVDSYTIALVDPSAACRIVPYLEFIRSFDPSISETWIGYGPGALEKKCNGIIVDDEDAELGAATNIVNFVYDNGLIIGFTFFC